MPMRRRRYSTALLARFACLCLFVISGCGVNFLLAPPLENAIQGVDLKQIEDIQNDERLTTDQQRDAIRELVGAEEDDAGDRLVEFLLNLNIP